jgi:DNA adenine methylase
VTVAALVPASDTVDRSAVDSVEGDADSDSCAADEPARSFLRWAGGKRWLLHHLPSILGGFKIHGYHEPFLGGGAVFFGSTTVGQVYLSDLNADLIETYVQVRDRPGDVAGFLEPHVNTSEHYYEVRASESCNPAERAANFIYLNHTSYNGIYRVNLMGRYNVPYGRRLNAQIPSRDLLSAVSRKLQSAIVSASDFQAAVEFVRKGDLIFLDPPYTVAHNNNGFVKYNQRLFSFEDQTRLSEVIDAVRKRDAFYILTNAAHDSIATLFEKGDRRLELTRGNSIGGYKATRGSATEYIFTNLPNDG